MIYKAVLIITIATTTVIACSFWISARNISLMEAFFISTVDFSLMHRQVIRMKITNNTAMISANLLYPIRLISLSVVPPNAFPSAATLMTVTIDTSAEPTPAQERANADNPSLSFPASVNAGIILQNGISIIV